MPFWYGTPFLLKLETMEGWVYAVKTQPNKKPHIFCGSKEDTTFMCHIDRLLTYL